MQKIKLQKDIQITPAIIDYVLDKHEAERNRIAKLRRYYQNDNDIMKRKQYDTKKPHNKLSHGYGSYITNMSVGYFLGKPISYKSDKKELLKSVLDIFKYNDESDNNATLAKEASIYGYALELQYTDEDGNLRFKCVPGEDIAIVYDNTLEENINFALRYFKEDEIDEKGNKEEVVYIDVYTKNKIMHFKKANGRIFPYAAEGSTHEQDHYFYDVPITIYLNNDEGMGDFERVISLIDAYDLTQSDTANDFEYFTNCILVVSGYILDEDDDKSISDARTLNFQDNEGKAEYLIKNIQDTALENYKNRLDNDIHKFTGVPNMSDEEFSNNASGVALQFKLMALENITGIKESKFKKGILRRIELICNALSFKKGTLDNYMDIIPVFTRTKPINLLEEAQRLQTLKGIYSDETILSISSEIDNPTEELERLKHEQLSLYNDDYSEREILENAETEE